MDEKDETLAEMDAAAKIAEEDFLKIPEEQIKPVADWWRAHYKKAGHKRLGKILIQHGK